MKNSLDILQQYWGYDSFRPKQKEIIESVLTNHDTLALLPTGGGKSICYQIPALVKEGICLVVSPLIALMEDQIRQLHALNIKAIAITSNMSRREIDYALDNMIYGDYKFLYVSPERLKSDIFLARFPKMKINLIAIDEAHCVSTWGYDFRPAYLSIVDIRKLHPKVPVLALTATATSDVINDIQEKLNFSSKNVVDQSFERKNLTYNTIHHVNKEHVIDLFLTRNKGCGIIYCSTRKNVKTLYNYLLEKGHSVGYYHGGLDYEERKRQQHQWTENKSRVIVATNAFGMGIDKGDVRFVLHYNLPDTLEAYYQEVGRAGRDNKEAVGWLIYNKIELDKLSEKINQRFPPLQEIKSIYHAMSNHFQLAFGSGKDEKFEIDLAKFSDKYEKNLFEVYNALKILERCEFIVLSENYRQPSKLKFIVNNAALYNYQVKNKNLDEIIKYILRSHIGIFENEQNINEFKIATKLNISMQALKKSLQYLKDEQVILYSPRTNLPTITYTTERLQENNLFISPDYYAKRKVVGLKKLDAVIDFVQTESCKSAYLLSYFGELKSENCGKCSSCKQLEKTATKDLHKTIIQVYNEENVNNEFYAIKDLLAKLNGFDETVIFDNLRRMADNKLIEVDHLGQTFKIS